jgi:hypothetical protein
MKTIVYYIKKILRLHWWQDESLVNEMNAHKERLNALEQKNL